MLNQGIRFDTNQQSAVALKQCRHGPMLYLPRDRFVGRSLDLYGEFSELEARVFDQILAPGAAVIEVGANIGAHTVHLAKLVGPNGNVLAFEPQRAMFYLLCANLALNEQFQVRAYRAAVGRQAGSVEVPLIDHRTDANFGGVSVGRTEHGEEVPLTTLDRFPFNALHLIKIDVEGMEIEVLLGARATIAQHRPILYVENDRRENSHRLIQLIEELGYDLHWHTPPLFNPENFAGASDNVFPGIVSINVLCVPKGRTMSLVGFRRVAGPNDWWNEPG